jgi:hypothetical protein
MWLYQLSQEKWSPKNYRLDIWENERWKWPVGRAVGSDEKPEPGDIAVFFYAHTGGGQPGFYGWAVILQWLEDEERRLYFRPVAPSDQLKMHPWWDEEARRVANEVRGEVKQGTLWRVPDRLASAIAAGLTAWVGAPGRNRDSIQATESSNAGSS